MTRLLGKAAAVAGGLALLTGVALAGAPAAGAAAAGAAASNQILNWNSDLCLGINGGGGEWGRTAIQWDCNGNPDQKWNFWASSGSYSTVKNENGLCLGIRNASAPRPCSGSATATTIRSGASPPPPAAATGS
ncbi:RICIN domain-containing protein [Streptomyces virginiae]|uniref:RICIN domain-containing protein n=1 Tax=Streptomyces virginiae TaxID=1961 RepID=UPI0035E17A88